MKYCNPDTCSECLYTSMHFPCCTFEQKKHLPKPLQPFHPLQVRLKLQNLHLQNTPPVPECSAFLQQLWTIFYILYPYIH